MKRAEKFDVLVSPGILYIKKCYLISRVVIYFSKHNILLFFFLIPALGIELKALLVLVKQSTN